MLFIFFNFAVILAVMGTITYVAFGNAGKQLSAFLFSLAAGVFVLWCGAVGLYHVVINLFYVPQAVTNLIGML